jgi:O-antigen/teichoic acid export membrane protein
VGCAGIIHKIRQKITPILSHTGFRRYFANTSWLLLEKIARLAFALTVGVYVARHLGPERFGELSYATSFVGLFSVLATLGLDGIVIRNLVQNEGSRDRLLGTAFTLKLAGGIILLACVSISIQYTASQAYAKMLVIIIAGASIFQAFKTIDLFFQSQVMGKLSAVTAIVSLCVAQTANLVLIFVDASLVWFAWTILLESVVLGAMLVYFYSMQHFNVSAWRFDGPTAIELLKDSWPLIMSGFAVMVYMRIDQVMINEMIGPQAVGNYAAAVKISTVFYFIPVSIANALFPAILNAKKQNSDLYHARLQSLYDLMALIAVAIALPMTFLSGPVIALLYGDAYLSAGRVLTIHIWSGVFVFIGVSSGKWLLAENLQNLALHRSLLGAIVNVILNYILIPRSGIVGAAIATLISQAIGAYLAYAFFKETKVNFIMQSKALLGISVLKKIGRYFGSQV